MKLIFDIETDDLDATKVWCIVAKELNGKSYRFTPDEIEDGIKLLQDADTLPNKKRKKQKIFLKDNVGRIFKYLKDKQVLKKSGLNDELINKMETDIQMTLFGEVSTG